MSALFCGIDVGTTNLKVLLLDDEGKTVWVKSVPAPHLNDGIGIVTDTRALLTRIEDLIIEGWRTIGQGRVIRAIASAGIGEDGVCIDKDFNPLGHAIQWNDRRGEIYAHELAQTDAAKDYPTILLDFSSSAGKWAWLTRNRSDEIQPGQLWITMTDWAIVNWSGEAFMSATLAPRTGCFDIFTRTWVQPLLTYCSAPPLPKLVEAGEAVGTMKPGRLIEAGAANAHTLLVAGGHDHPIAASAIRRLSANARIDSMGTANATYGESTSLFANHDMEGLYVSLPISGASGAAVIGMTEFSVSLAKQIPDLAAFYASMLECRNIADIPKVAAAILENLAQRTSHYWAAMTRAGVPEAPIFATGGWARCPALMQMRASVFGEAVTVVDEPELVAFGAALYAAQGARSNIGFSLAGRSHQVGPKERIL
jgi:xylulokinase